MDKQFSDGEIITAFEAAGVEFMTVYNLNENANVCLTAGSQKASKIITAARALLSQQVEAARNAALEWVNGTPYAVDKVWAIDERDLMHLLSVKIGAVYVDPVAAAERARVHIAPLSSSPAQAEQKGKEC